jgi:hypothetical protein
VGPINSAGREAQDREGRTLSIGIDCSGLGENVDLVEAITNNHQFEGMALDLPDQNPGRRLNTLQGEGVNPEVSSHLNRALARA